MTVTSDFIACCTRCHPITSPAFSPAVSPSLARLQPHSRPCSSAPGTLQPQGLCTGFSRCLEHSATNIFVARPSSLSSGISCAVTVSVIAVLGLASSPSSVSLLSVPTPATLLRVPVYHVHDLPRGNVSPMGQGFCSGLFTPAPPVPKMAPGMQCLLSE